MHKLFKDLEVGDEFESQEVKYIKTLPFSIDGYDHNQWDALVLSGKDKGMPAVFNDVANVKVISLKETPEPPKIPIGFTLPGLVAECKEKK